MPLGCKILNLNKKLRPQHICPFVVVTYEHQYQICNVTQKDNNFFTGPRNYAVFVAKTSKYTLIPTTVHTLCQDNHKAINTRLIVITWSAKIFSINQFYSAYLIFVIFFTRAKFLENRIYTGKRQFFALNL